MTTFITTFRRKFSTAVKLTRLRGPMSVVRIAFYRLFEDRRLLGRIVEAGGNTGSLEGASFDLSSPVIATELKSRFFLKSYESEARSLIRKYLPRQYPVIELGGGMGVVSCVTNRLLTHPEAHVVVEANPDLLPVLSANRMQNNCKFQILGGALAYGAPEVDFYAGERFNEGSLYNQSDKVRHVGAVTLDSLLKKYGFERVSLICDIEGSEMEMIATEGKVLADHVAEIIMETHGIERSLEGQAQLESLGFALVERFDNNEVYRNTLLDGA